MNVIILYNFLFNLNKKKIFYLFKLIFNYKLIFKNKYIKIYIIGFGCSGLKYGFILIYNFIFNELLLKINNFFFILDFFSFFYFINSKIKFYLNLKNKKNIFLLKLNNFNILNKCECNLSFLL